MANADWRNAESGSSDSAGARGWESRPDDAASPNPPSRRSMRRIVLLALFAGLVLAFVALILYPEQPRPSCLVVIGSGYEPNLFLPQNVHGWNGGLRLAKREQDVEVSAIAAWFHKRIGQRMGIRRLEPVLFDSRTWDSAWRDISVKLKNEKKEQVILYFSAHAYADQHDAYLLRDVENNQSAEDFNKSRVPFSEILDSIKSVDSERGVLLILDVCHVQSHWPIGMLQNDFVERLKAKYENAIMARARLTVICSTSPGQKSWAAEEKHSTVFAEYVAKGLRGEGHEPGPITATSLFKYVKEEVNKWAQINRSREQVPILIGDPGEFELAQAKEETPNEQADDVGPRSFNPENLRSFWKQWKNLKDTYAPQVYCPHYWRLYQDALLRYEQLVRAGDPTSKADAVRKKLQDLESQITSAKELDKKLASLGNCIPLGRALGHQPSQGVSSKNLQQLFEMLKLPNSLKKAAEIKAFLGNAPPDREYGQAQLARLCLEEHLRGKTFDYQALRRDLRIIADELGSHRSAETHLVKMLQDVDPAMEAQADKLQLAVRVRMRAEEAAVGVLDKDVSSEPYAEAIFSHVESAIRRADEVRREGEDLLFGDPATHASQARKKLDEAQKQYDEIVSKAQRLRKAMALRDSLCAELPYYASTLALIPAVDAAAADHLQTMQGKAQSLGKSLAALNHYLERSQDKLPDLDLIAKELEEIRDRHGKICEALSERGAKGLQKNWHALDGALMLPPTGVGSGNVETRIKLMHKLKENAKNLAAQQNPAPGVDKPGDAGIQKELLRTYLLSFKAEARPEIQNNVEDKVRELFLGQLKAIQIDAAKTENDKAMNNAAWTCRFLLGSQADLLTDQRGVRQNPPADLRRLRAYNLLVGLAGRTLEDHWFDPGAKTETTYYGPVAKAYLDDAVRIFQPKDQGLLRKHQELEKLLPQAGIQVAGEKRHFWAGQLDLHLENVIDGQPGVPRSGRPSYWFQSAKDKTPIRKTAQDLSNAIMAEKQVKDGDYLEEKDAVTLHALFRGQKVSHRIELERTPPNVVVRHAPGPDKVTFAVRMDKLAFGAISFMLDTSGSMRAKHKKEIRFYYAKDALLKTLANTEEETLLSVCMFNGKKKSEPQFVEWKNNPTGKYYAPWNEGRKKSLENEIDSNELKNSSPICQAILDCMQHGLPPAPGEVKLVVALTDGADNLYGRDEEIDLKNDPGATKHSEAVAKALHAGMRRHPDVEILVVCFLEEKDAERAHAKVQFQPVGARNLIFESDGEKLARTIADRLSRYVEVRKNGVSAPGFENGRRVNYKGDNVLDWGPNLRMDDYQVNVRNTPQTAFQMPLGKGDRILAMLRREEGKFKMERGIIGQQRELQGHSTEKNGDWLVTLLKNQRLPNEKVLRQLVAIEKTTLESNPLQQVYPGFVWLEVETQDGKKHEETVEWHTDLVVPAPAYAVDVKEWPGGSPKLTAWFWPRPWEDLLSTVKPLAQRRIHIRGFKADDLIESVRWESRPVGVVNLKDVTTQKRNCVVFRTKYLDGHPVYVGLANKSQHARVESEHQFFDAAGRSMACFFNLEPNLEELDVVLIRIDRFKLAAEAAGARAVLRPDNPNLPVPDNFHKNIREVLDASR